MASEFARGFKSWCENTATGLRKVVGLESWEPLPGEVLAQHLGVMVWDAKDVPAAPVDVLAVLLGVEKECWSALTVEVNGRAATILNSTHSRARRSSSLMHEISHIVLGHSPARIDVSPDGMLLLRSFDPKQEAEANWLAGCLLLPRDALFRIRRDGLSEAAAREAYDVSKDMLEMRFRLSGVDLQLKRAGRRKAQR